MTVPVKNFSEFGAFNAPEYAIIVSLFNVFPWICMGVFPSVWLLFATISALGLWLTYRMWSPCFEKNRGKLCNTYSDYLKTLSPIQLKMAVLSPEITRASKLQILIQLSKESLTELYYSGQTTESTKRQLQVFLNNCHPGWSFKE